MKKIIKTLSYLLLGIIIFFILLIFINIFFYNNKYRVSLVLSGSMEPDISVNDLVILKSTDKFNVNDIVSYKDTSGKVVMHRIIKIDGNKVITKGDANNVSDKEIDKSQITGIYVCNIKYLGKIIKLIKTPIGLLLVLLLIVVIIFIPTWKDKVFNKKGVVGVSSVLLVIIVSCILGYYSQYKKSFGKTSSATIARFNVGINSNQSINLFSTLKNNENISDNSIIPGVYGVAYMEMYNNSDVSVRYKINITEKDNKYNIPIKYSLDDLNYYSASEFSRSAISTGVINYGSNINKIPIYWRWDIQDDNKNDSEISLKSSDDKLIINVSVNFVQVD